MKGEGRIFGLNPPLDGNVPPLLSVHHVSGKGLSHLVANASQKLYIRTKFLLIPDYI